jgi:glucuronokinase
MIIDTFAYARAGLLGNPSDGYFGKTISISVKNFGAHVSLYESPELHIEPQKQDLNVFRNIHELAETVGLTGYYGGDRLIKATIKRFYDYCRENGLKLHGRNFTLRYSSSIPRQVGLGGSSAIITATICALKKFYEIDIPKPLQPGLVLSVETDELGISAGLQDRVIQTYEGCVYMDFDETAMQAQGHGTYEPLDPALLPSLYIAYKTELGKVSGQVLNDIRTRFKNGDPLVIDTLREIAALADKGREALRAYDIARLNELVNRNFDLRCRIMKISPSNMEMIETARACGASASFAGSGGSVVGIYPNDETLTKLLIEMKKIKARVIRPYIV